MGMSIFSHPHYRFVADVEDSVTSEQVDRHPLDRAE